MTLGPGARLFYAEADALGRVSYRVENRRERTATFGRERAEGFWAVIDQVLTAAFFRPPAVRLRAVAAFVSANPRIFLLGDEWGTVLEGEIGARQIPDPLEEFREMMLPVYFADHPDWIGLRFCMNVHYREIFTRECIESTNAGQINTLEIFFETPSGEFTEASLLVQDKRSQRILRTRTLGDFPLVWSPSPLLESKGDFSGRTAPTAADVERDQISRRRRLRRLSAMMPPPVPAFETEEKAPEPFLQEPPCPPRPTVSSVDLPDQEMIALIRAERDDGRRWSMIEENLSLLSASRTYRILANFGDLIAERASNWSVELLVAVFGSQPGSLLAPIVSAWPTAKVIALAARNPEKKYLLDWLREREVERLLALDLSLEVSSRTAAREWLGVGEDPSPEEVKQTWRRLLAFLHGDFGRTTEKAVHRKKDEIAKRLQQARDLLARNR